MADESIRVTALSQCSTFDLKIIKHTENTLLTMLKTDMASSWRCMTLTLSDDQGWKQQEVAHHLCGQLSEETTGDGAVEDAASITDNIDEVH